MMGPTTVSRVVALAGVIVLGVGTTQGRAQYGQGGVPGAAPNGGMAMMANPYTNPYTNPYLNPYMTPYRTSPGNAALYLFGAQAAMGGIGSGQISGVRPGVRGQAAAQPEARPAEGASGGAGVPSSISRYFGRSPERAPTRRTGTGSFYNRQGRYYSSNRR